VRPPPRPTDPSSRPAAPRDFISNKISIRFLFFLHEIASFSSPRRMYSLILTGPWLFCMYITLRSAMITARRPRRTRITGGVNCRRCPEGSFAVDRYCRLVLRSGGGGSGVVPFGSARTGGALDAAAGCAPRQLFRRRPPLRFMTSS
jgi:hypothetical protein